MTLSVKLFFFGSFFTFVEVRDYGWNIRVYLKIKNLIRSILLIRSVTFSFVKAIFFSLKVDKLRKHLLHSLKTIKGFLVNDTNSGFENKLGTLDMWH